VPEGPPTVEDALVDLTQPTWRDLTDLADPTGVTVC